ncbi:POK18 protein, partial [Tachuris rubrigastra]|nr:POK18 protein [Tachuris rubrigastra]
WQYLGWQITDAVITPQKVTLQTNLTTLADVQTLMGDLQWLRTLLGIMNEDIAPLVPLLKGAHTEQ